MGMSIDFKRATVKIKDATPVTPKSLTVNLGEGNITWTEKRNLIYEKDRGKLAAVREGDEEPMDVQLSARWEFITASTGGTETIEDVLKHVGEGADWVSTETDGCQPFACTIEIEYTPLCDTADIEKIELQKFRYTEVKHDPKSAMLEFTGSCNTTQAVVTRTAQP